MKNIKRVFLVIATFTLTLIITAGNYTVLPNTAIIALAEDSQEITIQKFQNAKYPVESYFYFDKKPALQKLINAMPSEISAILINGSIINIPVTWMCTDGNYEDTNYYYYSFVPIWDKSQYNILIDDLPYTEVFLKNFSGIKYHSQTDIDINDELGGTYTGRSSEQEIFDFLIGTLNVNYATAVGIMANIYKESGFNPQAYNPNDLGAESYGICQWRSERLTALKSYCSNNGLDYTSTYGQLRYLQYELNNGESYAWSQMQGIENTQSGAYIAGYRWAQRFERCSQYYNGIDQFEQRGLLAQNTFWGLYDYVPSQDINVNNLYIPNIMTVGDKATITGTVSSGLDLTSVSLRIDNADQIGDLNNYQLSVSQTVSGKYFDLSSLGVDLSTFKPGVYKVTGSASNTDHSEMIISSVITILSNYDTGKSGTYVFRSTVNSSYVIGTGSDNNVQLVSYADTADRTWYAEYLKDGYYTIKNCASGLYLDIYSGGTDAGSNIWQYEGNQSYAQQWQILQSGSSYYLIPRCSLGCVADIDYGVMADGTNITIYYTDLYLNENQRFILDNSACSFYRPGHKVTFDANGGTLPNSSMDWSEFTVSGINTGRDTGSLIVYNIPGMTVNTNAYGYEAQVDKTGKVTALRILNDNSQLTVPDGGMVISGHFSGGNDGGTFVSTIAVGNYVGFDPDTNKVYVYRSEEEYTAHNKCVADGSVYGFLPTPSRYGYVFEGWYTSPVGGERITEYTVYSTDSLYAHWAKPTVSIFGDYTYTGQPIIPDIIVSVGDTVLINGTDYIVYYDKNTNAGTATYTVSAVNGGRYSFPDITGTFTINKAKATVSSAPKAISGLKYNGKEQELITAGTALNSLIAYSFDGITYSDKIPSATEAGTYIIYYKALGYGNNYTDSDAVKLTVTIEESNEIIKSISVRSQYLYVIYGYSGSDEISRRVNVAFNDVTDDMIDWMYKNDPSCGLLADFVNAFSPSEQNIILTAPELRAIEYVLNNDF